MNREQLKLEIENFYWKASKATFSGTELVNSLATFFEQTLDEERRKAFEAGREKISLGNPGSFENFAAKIFNKYDSYESYRTLHP